MNGSTRPMLSWNGHLAWLLKERVKFVVPTANVQTGKDKRRRSWGNIFGRMDFTADYTRWVYHGEADRMREEVVRPRIEAFDANARVADMVDDVHQA